MPSNSTTIRLLILSTFTITTLIFVYVHLSSTLDKMSTPITDLSSAGGETKQSSTSLGSKIIINHRLIRNSPSENKLVLESIVTNTNDHAVRLLTWSTPLDPLAGLADIFFVKDTSTNEEIYLPSVRFNRVHPPPAEDYTLIPPGEDVRLQIEIKASLDEGRTFEVVARGVWPEIWLAGALPPSLGPSDDSTSASAANDDNDHLVRDVPFESTLFNFST